MVRCGLAVNRQWLAVPLEIVLREKLMERIQRLVHELQLEVIVLGKADGLMEKEAESLQTELQQLYPAVRIVLEDETGSSLQAESLGRFAHVPMKKRRMPADHHAAALILQGWLDARK
jgi:RNase H-fold protein (predicted Holliday junction resolvase)